MTEPRLEVWDRRARRHIVRTGDRWRAAMLVWPDEPSARGTISFEAVQADAAWTIDGALRLAQMLPEQFKDLRDAIRTRFSPS